MKKGDIVTIARSYSKEGIGWAKPMDDYIGKQVIVKHVESRYFTIKQADGRNWSFPYECLEIDNKTSGTIIERAIAEAVEALKGG